MSYLDKVKERRREKDSFLKKAYIEKARRLTYLLIDKGYRFKRLYIFGLSLSEKPYTPWSDIDLAIEGLRGDLFFKVYAFLFKEAKFPVDLKPFEDLDRKDRKKRRSDL